MESGEGLEGERLEGESWRDLPAGSGWPAVWPERAFWGDAATRVRRRGRFGRSELIAFGEGERSEGIGWEVPSGPAARARAGLVFFC